MSKIIFLLEEISMEHLLRGLLPRLLPETSEGADWVLIPHSGKSDLETSLPRKLKGWREPGVSFLVIRDQDNGPCEPIKQRLQDLARHAGRPETVVRIACRELEAWYFGEISVLAEVYGQSDIAALQGRRAFRDPDTIVSPSQELSKRIPAFGKVDAARRAGTKLSLAANGNRSRSFQHVLKSIRALHAR